MKLNPWMTVACVLASSIGLWAQSEEKLPDDREPISIRDLSVKGRIEGHNITFTLEFTAETRKREQEVALMAGDVVLDSVLEPKDGYLLAYAPPDSATPPTPPPATQASVAAGKAPAPKRPGGPLGTYYMMFPNLGTRKVVVSFAARPKAVEGGAWRESQFSLPASRVRQLEVACDRADLEVLFPSAMRVDRQVREGKLVIAAVMGSGRPFAVRWKPVIPEMDAKLVFSSQANTIITASVGALRVDTLLGFGVSQGKLTELKFTVPRGLSITQVRGEYIRDWRLDDAAAGAQTNSRSPEKSGVTRRR